MKRIRSARSSALLAKLIESLFAVPAITVPVAAQEVGISYNAAKSQIQRLVDLRILTPMPGNYKPQWFFGMGIVDVVNKQDFQ